MLKELVVNVAPHETRMALLENSAVVEAFMERQDEASIVGNIYKGRVQRVLPGMQAAFVDIGFDNAAFIYVSDVQEAFINNNIYQYFEQDNDDASLSENIRAQDSMSLYMDKKRSTHKEAVIEDILTEGQELIVQVSKAAIDNKGPRLTTHISIAGRYMVLMPVINQKNQMNHIGVSRRISDDKERARLKNLLLSLKKNKFGYILRTQAQGINAETMTKEMTFLIGTWEGILSKCQTVSAPFLLYRDLNTIFKAVRDLLTSDADKLIIDSKQEHANIRQFCKQLMPEMKLSVELYEGRESIFDAYNIEADLTRALSRKVWLKSGGYIVIEQTEALVAIDVNTGKYVGKHNFDETILKTNLEAVKEIAYQIRLRNLGGIIIIDFIDMKKKQHRERVMAQLNEAMKKDPDNKAVYLSAENIISQFEKTSPDKINGFWGEEKTPRFLLLDDIQIVASHDKSQKELLSLCTQFLESKRQLVVAASTPPNQIKNLLPQLRSRLEWGLITEIEAPDQKTKMNVISQMAKQQGIRFQDDVTFFLASSTNDLKNLVHKIEKIKRHTSFYGNKMDISVIQSILENKLHAQIGPERIQEITAKYFQISPDDLLGQKKERKISYPRQVAIFLTRKYTDMSLKEIGRAFGNKHHSSIIYSINSVERNIKSKVEVINDINKLRGFLSNGSVG